MSEIKCPKCGEVFQVDETDYNQIAQQVRDEEFEKELVRRKKELEVQQKKDIEITCLQKEKEYTASITQKDTEISVRDQKIVELQAKLESSEQEKQLAVMDVVEKLKGELGQKSIEIVELKGKLENKELETKASEKALREKYEEELKRKDEELESYKDYKARLSTKMIGESLEQHCLGQFNAIRMTAFPNAYFEKDNDAKMGSKGDFIYREYDINGTEFISIMFEMKNEADKTATKHKNEDFFKELDKDRNEKGCEYAILVSLLERDNELYNNGIVDVSYKYPKMYVIRPQFFIPIISLLRNAAQNSLQYKQELRIARDQQIDIRNFEENMNEFKENFSKYFKLAGAKFQKAIEEIDRTIDHLQKIKDNLYSSQKQLGYADKKANELSIKKLTKNAPTVKAMFDELE